MEIDIKEESKEVIKQWLPGSSAEDFVVSANVRAIKKADSCCSAKTQGASSESACCVPPIPPLEVVEEISASK